MRSISSILLVSACCGLTLLGCSGGPSSSSSSNPFAKQTPSPARSEESWWAKNKPGFLKSKETPTFASQPDSPDSLSLATKSKAGPGVYLVTAQLYERSGNLPAATEHYEKALKADPNNLQALLGSARLLDRQNRLVEATAMYERGAKAHPQSPAAHNDLALCYARRRMMNEAISELNLAVKLAPDRALYRNNLATVYVNQNRLDEALQQLKAVHQEPIAYYNLGYLLQQQGQDELAMAQFTRAAQIDPGFHEARDWSQRLAAKTPAPSAAPSAAPRAPAAQLASLATPAPRATLTSGVRSYERAPEPGPPPSYLQSQPSSAGSAVPSSAVGSRYATPGSGEALRSPPPPVARATDVSVPVRAPAPRTSEGATAVPAAEAEYRFLPPVNASR